MTSAPAIKVLHIFISAGHNFIGHHQQPPGENEMKEVKRARCLARRGLEGDRFFDFKPHYKGQITFFAWEVYEALCRDCKEEGVPPSAFRRNVITRGVDLNQLIGKEFEIQGVRFVGVEECSPCHWMNRAFHPEAEARLHGRGGLRARILSDGWLEAES
jgi:MOSC domain-containing protein YiiM